jgi:uncharacterized protein
MRVWIDIDNSPHVPLFTPIIGALKKRGDEILITSREYAQTRELLEQAELEFIEIGSHAGAGKVNKILNLLARSYKLRNVVKSFAPDIALSHGSRALSISSALMGVPSVLMFDYEWTEMHIFKRTADVLLCPFVLTDSILEPAGIPLDKVRRYNGLKEELYLPSFVPDPAFRSSLGISDEKSLITIRPSAMTSNYHDSRSEDILITLLERMQYEPNTIAVVTPRTSADKQLVTSCIDKYSLTNVLIPEHALPGMQLLYWSDCVISGGGTMNRESALLGTRTVSMFTGKRPAIDEYLSKSGKLRFIDSPKDVATIDFSRTIKNGFTTASNTLIHDILTCLDRTVAEKE